MSDPLLVATEIVVTRLSQDIEDEGRRWDLATAITNHLDLAGLLIQPVCPFTVAAPSDPQEQP